MFLPVMIVGIEMSRDDCDPWPVTEKIEEA